MEERRGRWWVAGFNGRWAKVLCLHYLTIERQRRDLEGDPQSHKVRSSRGLMTAVVDLAAPLQQVVPFHRPRHGMGAGGMQAWRVCEYVLSE